MKTYFLSTVADARPVKRYKAFWQARMRHWRPCDHFNINIERKEQPSLRDCEEEKRRREKSSRDDKDMEIYGSGSMPASADWLIVAGSMSKPVGHVLLGSSVALLKYLNGPRVGPVAAAAAAAAAASVAAIVERLH